MGNCVGNNPNLFLSVTRCLENLSSGEKRAVVDMNGIKNLDFYFALVSWLTWMCALCDSASCCYFFKSVDSIAMLESVIIGDEHGWFSKRRPFTHSIQRVHQVHFCYRSLRLMRKRWWEKCWNSRKLGTFQPGNIYTCEHSKLFCRPSSACIEFIVFYHASRSIILSLGARLNLCNLTRAALFWFHHHHHLLQQNLHQDGRRKQ